ncbi:hypothetical protein, partial [Nocardia sp. NPDC019302]|uniref:hypothetical protein n=1 Tax=Nocardia sp. NPDC019302 TaxID=3154592 RepID=UPI0033FD0F76
MSDDDEFPGFLVPDVYSPKWPSDQLKLHRKVHDWLEIDTKETKSLLTVLKNSWDALGKGTKETVPDAGTVPQVNTKSAGVRASMFDNYMSVSAGLEQAFNDLLDHDRNLEKQVEKSKISSETARKQLKTLIETLNTQAALPPTGMSEDEHVMTYIAQGMESASKTMSDAKSEQEDAADGVDEDTDA